MFIHIINLRNVILSIFSNYNREESLDFVISNYSNIYVPDIIQSDLYA